MTSENIFEGISHIDSAFIERSSKVLKKRRFAGIAKYAAGAAAALLLTFGGLTLIYNAILANITSDEGVPPVVIAEINGAGYCQEGFHTGDIRKPYGLPEPSDELKGVSVGSCFVQFDVDIGGSVDFFEIKGSVNREILLGEYKGGLSYWERVNGGESFETARERLAYYGCRTVDDVHTMRVNGKNVKDRNKISEVWNALLNGTEITFEEYERLLQGENFNEADAKEVYSHHADSRLTIEFNYGELSCIRFGYYTDIDCFDGLGYIVSPAPIKF